jgi:hypothetical protein
VSMNIATGSLVRYGMPFTSSILRNRRAEDRSGTQ